MPIAKAVDPIEPDRRFRGILSISPEMIGELLRLPPVQKVIDARIADGVVELLVAGEGMPPCGAGEAPARVMIICQVESRPGDVAKGGHERRVTCWWDHAPETRWTQSNWHSFQPS